MVVKREPHQLITHSKISKIVPRVAVTHGIAWLLLLAVYFFVSDKVLGISGLPEHFFANHTRLGLTINALFFYSLYAILTYHKTHISLLKTSILCVLTLVIFIVASVAIDLFLIDQQWFSDQQQLFYYLLLANFIVKLWFSFIALFTFFSLVLYKRQLQDNLIRLATLETELALLKSQTHPHFLFNTLNSLYVSSYQFGDTKTAEGIGQMAAILRYMLHQHGEQTVSLTDEIALINDYIALQKLRFTDCLTVNFDHNYADPAINISPMLLIVLVENAFKYGIKSNSASVINISLQSSTERIVFTVSNTNYAQAIKANQHYQPSGMGITNLKQRLAVLYPAKHKLVLSEHGSEFVATLELTLC